jgi:hypothetical protein
MAEFYDDEHVLSRRFGPGVVVRWCHDDVYLVRPAEDRSAEQKRRETELDWIPSKK